MKLAILLTATIKVQVKGGNFSVAERAEMYASTLRYYAQTIGKSHPILFLENSDFDLSDFKQQFSHLLDIEWIQLLPSDNIPWNPQKGKGFNEYLMIKEGLMRSQKIKDCSHFLKITGRYAMVNIRTMIREIERRGANLYFMGDIKDTNLYERIGRTSFGHWGDSRFWVSSVKFYSENIMNCYMEMDDSREGMWAEHYMLRMARSLKHDSKFSWRFRNQVRFNGIAGMLTSRDLASGKYRQDSFSNRVKGELRHILRLLFPSWWF